MTDVPDLAAWLRGQVEDTRRYAARNAARRPIAPVRSHEMRELAARCEAELGILDEHYILREGDTNPAYEMYGVISPPFPSKGFGCVTCHYGAQGCVHGYGYCRTVRLLGSGYRTRDGYREEWAP